jgi:hypothetical protein
MKTSRTRAKADPWERKFADPVTLRDGRVLKTLSEAREVMLGLRREVQRHAYWQYAAELLLKAAESGDRKSIQEARDQLSRALGQEELLPR